MTTYIWTAKDKSGKPVVREVTHNTIEESKGVLLADGCTELKLIQDEVMDAAMAGFSEKSKELLQWSLGHVSAFVSGCNL